MSRTIDVGSQVGDYEVVSTLGRGGAGAVFLARHVETGREVALKVLHADHEMAEEIERRFVREIAVAQQIDSPYTVKYFDCGLGEDGVLYYTMEHVEWGSLKDVLRGRGALSWRDAAECAVQIARGLSALHEQNVVHRDLKPDNIFLSDGGRLKLGDFGLVRAIDKSRLTLDGTTVGTAKYLAPEQARALDVDARTDIYALGCNVFELIAARPPFLDGGGGATGYAELMRQHVETRPPRLDAVAPSCPTALANLVDRMLAKDPGDRPPSARALEDELQSILDRPESLLSNGPGVDEHVAAEVLTDRLRTHASRTAPQINAAGLVVVGVLLAIVVGLFAYWNR